MRGRAVEVVVALFDIFAVVGLGVGKAEEAFFEDGIVAIPQGDGEAEELVIVAYTGDAGFTRQKAVRFGWGRGGVVER